VKGIPRIEDADLGLLGGSTTHDGFGDNVDRQDLRPPVRVQHADFDPPILLHRKRLGVR